MAALNHGFETGHSNITKISQVTPEVTLFLRNLGFSNYYIIKIFDLVGETAVALTETIRTGCWMNSREWDSTRWMKPQKSSRSESLRRRCWIRARSLRN